MTTTTITALPAAAALTGTEPVPIDQGVGPTTVKTTVTAINQAASLFTPSTKGVVPLSGGGTTNFLRADGSWTSPPGTVLPSIGKNMSSPYSASIVNPVSGTTWKMQRMFRMMSPFAPLLQTFLDDMVQDCGFYSYSGSIGTRAFNLGVLSIASTSDTFGNFQDVNSREVFEIPFIAIACEGVTPTTDTGQNALTIGLQDAAGQNVIECSVEVGSGTNNRVSIAKVVSNTFTNLLSTANNSNPTGLNGLCLTIEQGSSGSATVTVYLQVNSQQWYPVLTTTIADFDLTAPATLKKWCPIISVTGGTTTPWRIDKFRTGYVGANNLRDFKIVTNKDGTPYVSNGYLYFTATSSVESIYRFNPKTGDFDKTGALVFNRGGSYFGDLNANIVWDADIGKWRVLWATWGNGLGANVKIFGTTYDGDILNGVHEVGGAQVNVTQQTGNAVYDECLVWDAANNRWLLVYTVSPGGLFGGNFYPALDSSPDLVTWTNIWAASGTPGYEGSVLSKIGGNFYVFSGNGANYRCWDTSGTNLGTMTVDIFPPTSGNPPPHFVPFAWMDGDTTQYYAFSWSNVQVSIGGVAQGTFTTGTPILYKADQTETGFEFTSIGSR